MKDHGPSDSFCSSAQGHHGPSLAGSLPQIRPLNVLMSGTDCQGKEYAGGKYSPRDVVVNAQMHIKRKENKPSLHIKGTLGKVLREQSSQVPQEHSTPALIKRLLGKPRQLTSVGLASLPKPSSGSGCA